MAYSLRTFWKAHDSDVRTLGSLDSSIISGSRDTTAKIFIETGISYELKSTITVHEKFVTSVNTLPPCFLYPSGAVITGGQDSNVIIYDNANLDSIKYMIEHESTVCSIFPIAEKGRLLTSSWDKTAKMWDLSQCVVINTYQGHTEAVWDVIFMCGCFVVTASADKTIKICWESGAAHLTLTGHTDCVRGLCVAGPEIFLSCGNDGTVRQWNVNTGMCYTIVKAHDNYLYSIECVGSLIALCGEGGFLSIWPSGLDNPGEKQVFISECSSIWSVEILPNRDIATGSSDGFVRMYTKNSARKAPPEILMLYKQTFQKAEYTIPTQTSSLKCYFEGKEYDLLFDVEIEELHVSYKLPYNLGDDHHIVAQEFLMKNNIEFVNFDIILNFLTSNTPDPSNTTPRSTRPYPPENYLTLETHDLDLIKKKVMQILKDLKFNLKYTVELYPSLFANITDGIPDEKFNDCLEVLMTCLAEWPDKACFPVLDIARIAILRDKVHPAICSQRNFKRLTDSLARFFNPKPSLDPPVADVNKMFAFRVLGNAYARPEGEEMMNQTVGELMPMISSSLTSLNNKGLQVSAATFIINMGLAASRAQNMDLGKHCSTLIKAAFPQIDDAGAAFRLEVAIGTIAPLVKEHIFTPEVNLFLKDNENKKMQQCTPEMVKAAKCAYYIRKDFSLAKL